jgi:hypothetical protein
VFEASVLHVAFSSEKYADRYKDWLKTQVNQDK